jgi:acetyl esterase
MLLRLIGQTLHLYAKHLHAAGVNALLYCGQSLVHGCLRAQSEVEEGDRLYNGLLAYLGSELLTQV